MTATDTGERRRAGDARPVITELIDEETVQSIAQEAWSALIGEDEYPRPAARRAARRRVSSSWVDVVGPWTGAVVLTSAGDGRGAVPGLLAEHAPPVLDAEDVADGLGELANVVGGNVKAVLPGPSAWPARGRLAPRAGPDDSAASTSCGAASSLTITLQGSAGAR